MSENQETALEAVAEHVPAPAFTRDQIDLIKATVAQGTTDEELRLFLYTAQRRGLDPLMHQIHAVKRWNAQAGREVMAIQTGIDGYRLIADRTGCYAPGRDTEFEERPDGSLVKATAYLKKLVSGTWHEVSASAYWDEYVQVRKDGKPNAAWARMPRVMLAKCAEAIVLRKAFPGETSGLYTDDEMSQADSERVEATQVTTSRVAPPSAPALPPKRRGRPPKNQAAAAINAQFENMPPREPGPLEEELDQLLQDKCLSDSQREQTQKWLAREDHQDQASRMKAAGFLKQVLKELHCTCDLPF